jgi:sulfur carrier protein
MTFIVNGEPKNFESISTVLDMLNQLDLAPETVVVELNEQIIKRDKVGETPMSDGDNVEIVRFYPGG